MNKNFSETNQTIKYNLRRSSRAKYMRISVYPDSTVMVTVPVGLSQRRFEAFIKDKTLWIIDKLEYFSKRGSATLLSRANKRDYQKYKFQAQEFVRERTKFLNQYYNFSYNRISIRNSKTRWGSCSRKGSLNFSYRIIFLSPDQQDYIIAHELCHLKEFNHSKAFWGLVAHTSPDYRQIRRHLRRV